MDNAVDRLNEAIKLYITKLTRDEPRRARGPPRDGDHLFTINLEHIGDIIDKNLCELAAKKIKKRSSSRRRRGRAVGVPQAFSKACSSRSASSCRATSRPPASCSRKSPSCATPSSPPPSAILSGCAKAAGEHRDDLAASRRAARPQAHPFAYLLGGLSGARSRRRAETEPVRGKQHRRSNTAAGLLPAPPRSA